MAYCKSCGAYIPDGLSACLACGFDENAGKAAAAAEEKKKAEKAAQEAAKKAQDDEMREIMDRHRRLQQEKSRQWAEKEKERRDRQEENRRWAEEEYVRRQAEREVEEEQRRKEAEEARRRETILRTLENPGSAGTSAGSGNTALAALSYLSFFFVGPFLLAPQDDFAMYHAKQGLRLFIFSAIADLIGGLTGIGWILSIFRIYCIFKGISNVLHGKKEPLPFIGTIGRQ